MVLYFYREKLSHFLVFICSARGSWKWFITAEIYINIARSFQAISASKYLILIYLWQIWNSQEIWEIIDANEFRLASCG